LFPPGTLARRVNAETALLLGGGRALLLQLAHPMVAAGVADHSDFRRDAFGRLANTLDLTLTVAFGDEDQRRAVLTRVADTYRALDPELLLWVHATLVDTAVVTHERFIGSIGPVARDRYHEEMKYQAVAFGVPKDRVPRSFEDLRGYMDGMVETLEVTDEARALSRGVLRPPSPSALRPLVEVMRFLTVGLLPERIRAGYGLTWGPRCDRVVVALASALRGGVVPLLPDALRRWPHARDADRRLAS
jgi:uncharacterized protein (DUF2236 family)